MYIYICISQAVYISQAHVTNSMYFEGTEGEGVMMASARGRAFKRRSGV